MSASRVASWAGGQAERLASSGSRSRFEHESSKALVGVRGGVLEATRHAWVEYRSQFICRRGSTGAIARMPEGDVGMNLDQGSIGRVGLGDRDRMQRAIDMIQLDDKGGHRARDWQTSDVYLELS